MLACTNSSSNFRALEARHCSFQLRGLAAILVLVWRPGAALWGTRGHGIAIGHTWKCRGCEEQSDCSESQHESFHGGTPLRKNSHRDTLLAAEGFSEFS